MSEQDVREAIEASIERARRAIDAHGVSQEAMAEIEDGLRELAATPGLGESAQLRQLHGSGSEATVLASEGKDGITLMYASFPPEQPTPVHDHGSWGVAYVLSGRDRYIHWKRTDDGSDEDAASLEVELDRIMAPGDAVAWFDPPGDIHSQQGHDGETAWELVMFGHNAMQVERHYFDVESGVVTVGLPA